VKRLFDIVGAAAGLIVLSPLFAIISGAIALESGRPIFYRGSRIGLLGRPFHILKFRTMVQDAESQGTTTAAQDPRITRIGRTLRRYKLDEIPQLLNVLYGEMSLVGPRPEVEEHTSVYTDEEREILRVLPGITDLSSVYFFRLNELLGSESPHERFVSEYRAVKNSLRLEYVRTRSAWLDCSILIATLTSVLSRGRWVLRLSRKVRPIARIDT